MRASPLIAVLATSFVASTALADSGYALRARPPGLDFIGDTVREMVPDQFQVPDVDKGFVYISNARVAIDVHQVELIPHDGWLELHVNTDITARADVDATITDCDISAYASPVDLRADLYVSTNPSGGLEVTAVDITIGLNAETFELDSEGCFIGDVVENVLEAVEEWAVEKATELLQDLAEEQILPMIQEQLNKVASLKLDVQGFQLEGGLNGLFVDPQAGLSLTADGQITWQGPTAPGLDDQGPPSVQPAVGPGLPNMYGPAAFALAASDDRVTHAVYEAWRSGIFEQLLGGLAPTIELSEEGIAQKLGLPGGTLIEVGVSVGSSPLIHFGRTGNSVRIDLRDLVVTADITVPGAATSQLRASIDGTLAASVRVNPALGSLQISANDLSIDRLEIAAGDQSLDVDPERLREFIHAVAVPMLGAQLENMPIAPVISPMEGLFAVARDVSAEGGWLRVAIDMYRPDPSDKAPPDTRLLNPPTIVSPAMAVFEAIGTDFVTPAELMRYAVRLDGEPVSEAPSFNDKIRVSAADGNHIIEVTAIDLAGNQDPTPWVHSFVVDGMAPMLELTEAPADVVDTNTVRFAWRTQDDRTAAPALETRWELRKIGDGTARGAIVAAEDFQVGRLEVTLPSLDSDTLFVLQVVARDEAGNVTSLEQGFAIRPGASAGGCSTSAGGNGPATWLLICAALGFVTLRRRRAILRAGLPVALLLATVATRDAEAQGVGTNLSGPTDADGAASFWNPAAMMRGQGTQVDAGSGVSFIRAFYDPMDSPDGSNTFVPKPEPTLGAFSDVLGRDVRIGFTLGVPQIDGASWSREDGASDITRWYAVSARSYFVTMTPSVAYQPRPWISFGAGVNVVRSQLEATLDKDMGKQLNQVAGSPVPDSPFPYAESALAAPTELDAAGWSVGAVAGVMVRPHQRVTIGASVHTPSSATATGSLNVTYPESLKTFVGEAAPAAELPPLAGDLEVEMKLPFMAFTAVAVEPAPQWEIRADYRFIDRSAIGDLYLDVVKASSEDLKDTAVVRGYQDRHSFGLRLSRLILDGRGLAALRARFEPNSVPETTVAPNNVDFDKYEMGVVARMFLSPRVSLVGQYSHYFMSSRLVDESLHQPLAEPELDSFNHPAPTGTYGGTADYVALSLSVYM